MVKTTLVEKDLEAGRKLLEALTKPNSSWPPFRVKAAFWLYMDESMEWRLVIATPLFEKGRLATYAYLQRVLASIQPIDLSLENLSVVSPRDPLVKAFREALLIAPDATGVRFTKSMVGSTYVDDAYLYRLPLS